MPPGLVYVSDELPGIQRHKRGQGFAYRHADGRWLSTRQAQDQVHLARIRSLAIPPAYVDVWICPRADGHLQATGRDARGRKQYRYHPQWRLEQDGQKFERMHAFGESLPRLRRRVARDLAAPPGSFPSRDGVLATLVRLLDTTFMRIGNEAYARSNRSYGLTTLRNRHADVKGARLKLRFRGKSGVRHEVAIEDPRVARIVRRCQAMPGQDLFQYEDEAGQLHRVGSDEVNDYIRQASGGPFTAKDFRTWHATVHAWSLLSPCAQALAKADDATEEAALCKTANVRRINEVLGEVASRLGNTVAVCRKSYVHPRVLTCAAQLQWPEVAQPSRRTGLSADERGLLAFLSVPVADDQL